MIVNCDIGERGVNHPVDIELMDHIDMANIACGGHAGDSESVEFYIKQAKVRNVKVTAHISYPDRENFGRKSLDITHEDLKESMDSQIKLMPGIKAVKFHGALYNDANQDSELADFLAGWLIDNSMNEIVTPFDSALAESCSAKGLTIIPEAFAERRYLFDNDSGRLLLVPRTFDYASITDCDLAVKQSLQISGKNEIKVYPEEEIRDIEAQTICIHSDSKIALELAKRLKDADV